MSDFAPSKTELLERRGERDLVREGKSVLEERRDLLARMMWEQIGRMEQLETEYGVSLKHARIWCRRAMARHGLIGLADFHSSESAIPEVQWHIGNRLGTPWLEYSQTDSASTAKPSTRPASLELGQAGEALQRLLALLLELAAAEGNLVRLTHAFRRTQRRVNALEHIILPELEQTIRDIESVMGEMERDDLVRSSLIKRRQSGGEIADN